MSNLDKTGRFPHRQFSWTLAVGVLIGALNLGCLLVFARFLGVNILGDYAALVVALDLIGGLLSFGFNQALIRETSNQVLEAAAWVASILQCIALALLTLTIVPLLLDVLSDDLAVALVGLLLSRILGIFAVLLYVPLERSMRYDLLAKAHFGATISGAVCGLGSLLAFESSVQPMMVKDLITAFTLVVIVRFVVPQSLPRLTTLSRAAMVDLWCFSRKMWALNVLERLAIRLDHAIVGALLGRESLGVYFTIRGTVEGILGFLARPIQTVVYVHYCRIGPNTRSLISMLRSGLPTTAAFTSVCVAVAALFGTNLVTLAFGNEFSNGGVLLPGLTVYAVAMLWYENLKVFAMAAHQHERAILGRAIQLVVLLIALYPLVQAYALTGAGWAVGAASTVLVASTLHALRRALAKVEANAPLT